MDDLPQKLNIFTIKMRYERKLFEISLRFLIPMLLCVIGLSFYGFLAVPGGLIAIIYLISIVKMHLNYKKAKFMTLLMGKPAEW